MSDGLEARARGLLDELGLAAGAAVLSVRPLAGGVASDIAVADLADGRSVCVKFALARLRVAAEWLAPVRRSRAEYAWHGAAARLAPGHGPALHGQSATLGGFAMEFVTGEGVRLWKDALLEGMPERGEAAAVGDVLGRIHAGSARAGFDRDPFANRDDFCALRIEPYLQFTASRHPGVADQLHVMAEQLYRADTALVHGDVSPKNILFRQGAPILLDAECATMGDPAFDVAFCLNHLLLKSVHRPESAPERWRGVAELWAAYAAHVAWEEPEALEARVSRLVPALMLARVDGKSPVEYLDDAGRERVRGLALGLLHEPPASTGELVGRVAARAP